MRHDKGVGLHPFSSLERCHIGKYVFIVFGDGIRKVPMCICFPETLQLARHPCTLTFFIDGIICFQPDVCHTLLCKMAQLSKRLSPFFTPEYITDRLVDEYPAPA